jgi:hypothetical protein
MRGVGTQTFTGTLDLAKDVEVGDTATMVIGGNATLGLQTAGAIILAGILSGVPRILLSTRNSNPSNFPRLLAPYMRAWYRRLARSRMSSRASSFRLSAQSRSA